MRWGRRRRVPKTAIAPLESLLDSRRNGARHEAMERARRDGAELEFETRGTGDRWCSCTTVRALAGSRRCSRSRAHRRLPAGPLPPCRVRRRPAHPAAHVHEAADFRALLAAIGIESDVVGHSASGCIAADRARRSSSCNRSRCSSGVARGAEPARGSASVELYARRGVACHRHVPARDVRNFARRCLGATERLEQALADGDSFFGHELPALRQWSFGPARCVTQPVLAVLGENSDARFERRQALLLEWLPTSAVPASRRRASAPPREPELATGLAVLFTSSDGRLVKSGPAPERGTGIPGERRAACE